MLFAYRCFVLVPITQPGLLDTAGVCIPVLCARADYSAWPIGYGRHLHSHALCLCQLLSLAYWIRQAFATSCSHRLLISQPGSLDVVGECILLLSVPGDHTFCLLGLALLFLWLVLQPGLLDMAGLRQLCVLASRLHLGEADSAPLACDCCHVACWPCS